MSIRFCDADVDCVYRGQYTRGDLRSVFFGNNGRRRLVCVLDDDDTYYGKISYQTYLNGKDEDMIDRTKVVLDHEIFEHAKEYFRLHWSEYYKTLLLPLVSEDGGLLSACYYDANINEATRKCREMKELEHVEGLFAEEIQQIIIYGCNEAAVEAYHLFKKNGYAVVVKGEQWEYLGINGDKASLEILDYRTYRLYAEGNRADCRYRSDILELLTYDVSSKFQFILDKYEQIPSLPFLEPWEKMEHKLKMSDKPVILMGFESHSYNYLKKQGIDITAVRLLEKDNYWQVETYLWYGKKVLSAEKIKKEFADAFYVVPYRADWERLLDILESEGYRRNQKVICLQDYMGEPEKSIREVIRNQKIVLTGEKYLCNLAARYIETILDIDAKEIYFLDLEPKYTINSSLQEISDDECKKDKNTVYFVVAEYLNRDVCGREYWQGKHYAKLLYQRGINNINSYFCKNLEYTHLENDLEWREEKKDQRIGIEDVKKVIYALIPGCSGNILMGELLDGHSEILFIGPYSTFRSKILENAIHLAKIYNLDDKIKILKKMLEGNAEFDIEKFIDNFREVLMKYENPSAKEVLIAFYISYYYTLGRKAVKDKFSIYVEPHLCDQIKHENNIRWFKGNGFDVKVLEIQRNSVQKAGSLLRTLEANGRVCDYKAIFGYTGISMAQESFLIRFEDLKKHTEWVMKKFCEFAELAFEKILVETTFEGQEGRGYSGVRGLDLKPVYHLYEEYFSEYDRFRIRLINFRRQKSLGYEYVDPADFSATEIEEIFSRLFRYEERIDFTSEDEKKEYMHRRKRGILYYFKKQKEKEVYYDEIEKNLIKKGE